MLQQEYKIKSALFRKIKNCDIDSCNGIIEIKSAHYDRLEDWSVGLMQRMIMLELLLMVLLKKLVPH